MGPCRLLHWLRRRARGTTEVSALGKGVQRASGYLVNGEGRTPVPALRAWPLSPSSQLLPAQLQRGQSRPGL